MARYRTEAPPVRSYGWSAEEYARQEHAASRRPSRPASRPASRDGSRVGSRVGSGEAVARGGGPGVARDGDRPDSAPTERRARMLTARRRMLWTLLGLSAAAVGLAFIGLAAWWVVVPPTMLLLGYLTLLREIARADAELAERRAESRAATQARRAAEAQREAERAAEAKRAAEAQRAADAAAGAGAPVWAGQDGVPQAEVIDISERVNDQLYDQYADAKLRAVGD